MNEWTIQVSQCLAFRLIEDTDYSHYSSYYIKKNTLKLEK